MGLDWRLYLPGGLARRRHNGRLLRSEMGVLRRWCRGYYRRPDQLAERREACALFGVLDPRGRPVRSGWRFVVGPDRRVQVARDG